MIRATIGFLLTITLSVWIATPSLAGYAEGKAAFDAGEYEKAYEEFEVLAARENVNAQFYLGILYRNGWGVLQDDREAARWLRFAAHQGHVEAQYTMGFMYQHGQGVTKDLIEAKNWYRMAARQGDADAQHNLNIIYYEEQNGPRPRSADQGDSAMSAHPSDWFDSLLGSIIGFGDAMSIGDVLAITAIVLIIVIPIVMPFSFFRIKPLLIQLSDNAAQRDRELLDEIKKIAVASAARDEALLEEFRKLTGNLGDETKVEEDPED